MLGKHDAIDRRPRDEPQSTGKHIQLQERDLIWFEKINLLGPLPSSYLHEYTKHLPKCKIANWAAKRMGDLFHEDVTDHAGRYLDRAPQQFETMHARYQDACYDLTEPSIQALREAGRYHQVYVHMGAFAGVEKEWKHRLGTACTAANIELGSRNDPDFRFVHQDELLARMPEVSKEGKKNPLRIPDTHNKDLFFTPDHFFAGEYGGTNLRLMAVEFEKSRKPQESSDYKRKTYTRNLNQWRHFIGDYEYKKYFGVPTARMVVLYVFTDLTIMRSVMDLLLKITEGKGCNFILFRYMPGFGKSFRVPEPDFTFYTKPWERAGREPFLLSEFK